MIALAPNSCDEIVPPSRRMWHCHLGQHRLTAPSARRDDPVDHNAMSCIRPGTCNLFQVTGQIATLQWSPGPDNVEHVNEGYTKCGGLEAKMCDGNMTCAMPMNIARIILLVNTLEQTHWHPKPMW